MSKKIKVYRLQVDVEHSPGDVEDYGPFTAECHNKELAQVCRRYKDDLGWVNEPQEDGIDGFHYGMKVGIHDVELLRHWFTMRRTMSKLFKAGFTLAVYEVPEDKVLRGRTQCAFHPDHATLVEKLDRDAAFVLGYGELATETYLRRERIKADEERLGELPLTAEDFQRALRTKTDFIEINLNKDRRGIKNVRNNTHGK